MTLRIAISGSAGTGKTTLARALAHRLGLPLIPEAMRAYLESGGPRLERRSKAEATVILTAFQRALRADERRLGVFVADNGALDLEAYARWYGCAEAAEGTAWGGRYDAVVLLPAGVLPYVRDGLRHDDPVLEARFQALLEDLARAAHPAPNLLRMPGDLLTVEARTEWVLRGLRAPQRGRRSAAAVPGLGAGPA